VSGASLPASLARQAQSKRGIQISAQCFPAIVPLAIWESIARSKFVLKKGFVLFGHEACFRYFLVFFIRFP